MIGKRVFVDAIRALEQANESGENSALQATLLRVLEEAMECTKQTHGKTWIRWWVEDNDFGKNNLNVLLRDHEEAVESPEELYDLLVFDKMNRK